MASMTRSAWPARLPMKAKDAASECIAKGGAASGGLDFGMSVAQKQ